jgi:hypothetical protein
MISLTIHTSKETIWLPLYQEKLVSGKVTLHDPTLLTSLTDNATVSGKVTLPDPTLRTSLTTMLTKRENSETQLRWFPLSLPSSLDSHYIATGAHKEDGSSEQTKSLSYLLQQIKKNTRQQFSQYDENISPPANIVITRFISIFNTLVSFNSNKQPNRRSK